MKTKKIKSIRTIEFQKVLGYLMANISRLGAHITLDSLSYFYVSSGGCDVSLNFSSDRLPILIKTSAGVTTDPFFRIA